MTKTVSRQITTAREMVDYLEDQHATIQDLFAAALEPEKGIDTSSFDQLRALLAIHEAAEATVVHPRLRDQTDHRRGVANTRLAEEHYATSQFQRLESLTPGSAEFITALAALRSLMMEHIEREEQEEFPLLTGELDPEDKRRMELSADLAELVVPLHSRPGSEPAIAHLTVGSFTAILDRARNILAAV